MEAVRRAQRALDPMLALLPPNALIAFNLAVCTRLALTYQELGGSDSGQVVGVVEDAWTLVTRAEDPTSPEANEMLSRLMEDDPSTTHAAYAADALVGIADWFADARHDVLPAALDILDGFILDQGPLVADQIDEDATWNHSAFQEVLSQFLQYCQRAARAGRQSRELDELREVAFAHGSLVGGVNDL